MDAAELTKVVAEQGQIAVPYFDDALVTIEQSDGLAIELVVSALQGFLRLTAADRRAHARFVEASMRAAIWASGPEVLRGLEPPSVETIWDHFTLLPSLSLYELVAPVATPEVVGDVAIVIGGNVPWDPDHGLYLRFGSGILAEVGSQDAVLDGPEPGHEDCVHCGAWTDIEFCAKG